LTAEVVKKAEAAKGSFAASFFSVLEPDFCYN
jgi:hypothetical protein